MGRPAPRHHMRATPHAHARACSAACPRIHQPRAAPPRVHLRLRRALPKDAVKVEHRRRLQPVGGVYGDHVVGGGVEGDEALGIAVPHRAQRRAQPVGRGRGRARVGAGVGGGGAPPPPPPGTVRVPRAGARAACPPPGQLRPPHLTATRTARSRAHALPSTEAASESGAGCAAAGGGVSPQGAPALRAGRAGRGARVSGGALCARRRGAPGGAGGPWGAAHCAPAPAGRSARARARARARGAARCLPLAARRSAAAPRSPGIRVEPPALARGQVGQRAAPRVHGGRCGRKGSAGRRL
jgi:hypothetical protein